MRTVNVVPSSAVEVTVTVPPSPSAGHSCPGKRESLRLSGGRAAELQSSAKPFDLVGSNALAVQCDLDLFIDNSVTHDNR